MCNPAAQPACLLPLTDIVTNLNQVPVKDVGRVNDHTFPDLCPESSAGSKHKNRRDSLKFTNSTER